MPVVVRYPRGSAREDQVGAFKWVAAFLRARLLAAEGASHYVVLE